ncbi:MAG: hypothetical protein QOH41_354 [Blastocatellia bacterium]|jgi:hypothetical protein|nr:hypothetical protein [Blastocatellia bacterium]
MAHDEEKLNAQNDEWLAAYYPLETISNPRSRAIMCLLFDRVINYFPVSGMACGGGSGISGMVLEGDLLYENEVIEAREETLLGDIDLNSTDENPWGTRDEFDRYIRLQVTAMAADAFAEEGVVPVTDDSSFRVPASLIESIDLSRHAYVQASILAMKSLEIVLPAFAQIPDLELLEAREKLKEHLVPFRRQMLSLAPAVRSGLKSGATIDDVHREAEYVIQTRIAPVLGELKDRLRQEKGKFWRNLLLKGGGVAPKFVLNYVTSGAVKAAVSAIGDVKELACDAVDHGDAIGSLKRNGGLGYLLAVNEIGTFR